MDDYNRGALKEPCLRLPYGGGDEYESVELGDGTGYVRLTDYEKAVAENERLRDYVYALEECNNKAHYCEFCPHFHYGYEYDPHCDFDFDSLRSAAGIEVDE